MWFLPLPCGQQKRSHSAGKVDRQLSVARGRANCRNTLAVSVAVPIAKRAKSFNDRLATAENLLKDLFRMLLRGEIQNFRRLTIEFRQIISVAVLRCLSV